MRDQERLERAQAHIITAVAVSDSAARLTALNLRYGLAKVHCAQELLGSAADATFVAAADLTTPRQTTKWQWGLAMGGMLTWGDGSSSFVPLDLQIGTSTVLVGALESEPELRPVVARAHALAASPPTVMGLPVAWDYAGGNHFINAYRVTALAGESLPPFVFLLHGGGSDVKRPSVLGPGLDYEASLPLREQMTILPTPFGPARVVTGAAALEYHHCYENCLLFSRRKQLCIGAELFGCFETLSHTVHHGLSHLNGALLGCSRFADGEQTLFPVTLRSDLPAFLIRGTPNLSAALLEGLDIPDGARSLALRANLLPHGGGYTYPGTKAVRDVISLDGTRYYVLETEGGGERVVGSLTTLAYAHRGLEVIERVRECRLGEIVARLDLLFSVTT